MIMQLTCEGSLLVRECRRPADPPAGGAGGVDAGARTLSDEGSLVLCERRCELVKHAT